MTHKDLKKQSKAQLEIPRIPKDVEHLELSVNTLETIKVKLVIRIAKQKYFPSIKANRKNTKNIQVPIPNTFP